MAMLDILKPQMSKVARDTNGVVITVYGENGTGKTPAIVKTAERPIYLACGKSGLSGLPGIPFFPVKNWSDFKKIVKALTPKEESNDYQAVHEAYQTIVLDELEILYSYCEQYICDVNNSDSIKSGNGGYGLWQELKKEWEETLLKLIGSNFCTTFILHATLDEEGIWRPVGDAKRMLPIITNHSEIIGFSKYGDADPDTGKRQHSTLVINSIHSFGRSRNDFFPVDEIPQWTFAKLIEEHYKGLEIQEKEMGIKTVTSEEQNKLYETEDLDYDKLMSEAKVAGKTLVDGGYRDDLTAIVEKELGQGKKIKDCTKKQSAALSVILDNINTRIKELGL